MTAGRLLLLPALLGESAPEEVLPAAVLRMARETRVFLAERAKSARAFLAEIGHPTPMQELAIVEIGHDPDRAHIDEWLRPLQTGQDVALLAEAGCPAIADPGASIVARAHEMGFAVRPLVGPSAILLALMASGLDGQRFRFVGYLPQDPQARDAAILALESASRHGETQLFMETPYRNDRLFEALLRTCAAQTRLTVAIAVTTSAESISTRTIASWRELAPGQRPSLHHLPAVFALLGGPGERLPRRVNSPGRRRPDRAPR